MRVALVLLIWASAIDFAAAHGFDAAGHAVSWRDWSSDPVVLVPLLLAVWLYARGAKALWSRAGIGRGILRLHAMSFALGALAIAAALASPLDVLSGTLLSAHMAQHGLLVVVAPPLLVFGNPGVALVWALPPSWRERIATSKRWRFWAALGRAFSRPLPAAAMQGLALWAWHVPAAFDAAAANYPVHLLEHACFLGTALLFWRAILAAGSPHRTVSALAAVFATLIHSGLLGALITLAPVVLYTHYSEPVRRWGLIAIEDQQLAGLLMWVPMGVVYIGACLMLASRLVVTKEARAMPVTGLKGRAVLP